VPASDAEKALKRKVCCHFHAVRWSFRIGAAR
jgi:hypothetical protein